MTKKLTLDEMEILPELYKELGTLGQVAEVVGGQPERVSLRLRERGTIPQKTYKGYKNALEYFKAHKDEYVGLTKYGIAELNSGLYCTLLKEGNLKNAMRETYLFHYKKSNGNASRAALVMGCSRTTLVKGWREIGLSPQAKRGRPKTICKIKSQKIKPSKEKLQEISDKFEKIGKIARKLKFSNSITIKLLREYEIGKYANF